MPLQGFAKHREFTGREPDAVVFSSFLWDMQRWGKFFPDKLTERGLSSGTIQEWAANFEAVLALIKVLHQRSFVEFYVITAPSVQRHSTSHKLM